MKGKILAPPKQCPSLVMNLDTTGADNPLQGYFISTTQTRHFFLCLPINSKAGIFPNEISSNISLFFDQMI